MTPFVQEMYVLLEFVAKHMII